MDSNPFPASSVQLSGGVPIGMGCLRPTTACSNDIEDCVTDATITPHGASPNGSMNCSGSLPAKRYKFGDRRNAMGLSW